MKNNNDLTDEELDQVSGGRGFKTLEMNTRRDGFGLSTLEEKWFGKKKHSIPNTLEERETKGKPGNLTKL